MKKAKQLFRELFETDCDVYEVQWYRRTVWRLEVSVCLTIAFSVIFHTSKPTANAPWFLNQGLRILAVMVQTGKLIHRASGKPFTDATSIPPNREWSA